METLILLLFCVVIFFSGYMFGSLRAWAEISRKLKEAADSIGMDLDKEFEELEQKKSEQHGRKMIVSKIENFELETHNDVLYLFNTDTNSFVCQGSTLEEIAKTLSEVKKIKIAMVNHNDKNIWFVDGEVKNSV